MTCNGFGSHVNVPEDLEEPGHANIVLFKEEGDIIHAIHSYYQSLEKCDKLESSILRDMVCSYYAVRSNLYRYVLVATLCVNLNKNSKLMHVSHILSNSTYILTIVFPLNNGLNDSAIM